MKKPVRLFVDATPIGEEKISGIPLVTAQLLLALSNHPEHGRSFQLVLAIPRDRRKQLDRWPFANVQYKTLPIALRPFNLLWKYGLLPPMDLLLGKGIYLFPNYRNWSLVRSKSLTYIHDLGFVRFPESVQPKNLAFLQSHINRWIKRTDRILTGSEHARKEIIELLHIAPAKIGVVYHGVDHAAYRPHAAAEVAAAKKRYGIEGNYLVYIGSLEPRKNLLRLIDAYLALPEAKRQKYSLVLIGGGGWLNDDVLAAIASAQAAGEHVLRPTTYVPDADLPALIAGATALLHPALYEGFGLSPLQAMASGVPVVVADNSSLPEVVGKAALLVNATDTTDISAKINTMIQWCEDPVKLAGLRAAGIQQAAQFSWQQAADDFISQMQKV